MDKRGMIQIYTGNGKGKTTAAIGLACRARGHDLEVCYIYFHKCRARRKCGEFSMLEKIGVDIYGFAENSLCFDENIDKIEIRKQCLKALKFIENVFKEEKYDLLILDEINISLRDGFLLEKEVLDLLNSKPVKMELILTGRDCSENIIKKADLVSEIKKIKHPYNEGVKKRKGIEY